MATTAILDLLTRFSPHLYEISRAPVRGKRREALRDRNVVRYGCFDPSGRIAPRRDWAVASCSWVTRALKRLAAFLLGLHGSVGFSPQVVTSRYTAQKSSCIMSISICS